MLRNHLEQFMSILQIRRFHQKIKPQFLFKGFSEVLLEKSLQKCSKCRVSHSKTGGYPSETALDAKYSPSLGSSDSRSDKAYPGLMTLCSSGAFETFYWD